jgi:hypothetical protein
MVNFRHFLWYCLLASCLLAPAFADAQADDIFEDGPIFSKFRLTLTPGWREEAAGPFFYEQEISGQTQWALPPFFCRTLTPEVDWSEWDLLYPLINYRRFGTEHRLQFGQLLSFSGGESPQQETIHHTTLFPLYFHQSSTEPKHDYTAVFPLFGHLENRMFRDDIKFMLFPLYSETRKKDVITDNYLYPIFDRRRGGGVTGWEVWPFYGEDVKIPTIRTNAMGDTATNGGYDNSFVLWPFFIKSRAGLGTTNPSTSFTMVPFYSQTFSPARETISYGFPFGFSAIHDREQNYVEHNFIWPLFVKAHGSKTVARYFPFYSSAKHNGLESDFYGFFLYKYTRLQSPPVDRHRTRILYFLYSDTVERNTASHDFSRRVDFWPFYDYHRTMDGNRRLQIMSILEPIFPNNRTMTREYAQVYSFWRQEKNARTGATSRSLLWNLYRRETLGQTKKASLFFGLIRYQSTADGGHWRFAGLNLGGKTARTTPAKS